MKKIDLSNVEDFAERKFLVAGGYVCKITAADDEPNKEYLKIEYDIAEGEFKGYYNSLFDSKGFWAGKFVKSYKDKALKFFKAFITAIEESNPGFHWQNDEKFLRNRLIGLVLAEEEYKKRDGSTGTRLYVASTRSVQAIRKGDFTVPGKKLLATSDVSTSNFVDLSDDDGDLPF